MNRNLIKKTAVVMLCLAMLLSVVVQTSCKDTPTETTPAETTKDQTPETTPEATESESAPETTAPEATEQFNISYDLDGGILEGNPIVYDGKSDIRLIIPIRPGYDFIGWTGTGVDTPTVSLTIPSGTEGDLSFKANWAENTDFAVTVDKSSDDVLVRAYNEKAKAVIVKNKLIDDYNEQAAREFQNFLEKNKTIIKMLPENIIASSDVKYELMFFFGKSSMEPMNGFSSELALNEYGVLAADDSLCFLSWDQLTYEGASAIYYEILDHVFKGGSYLDFVGGKYVSAVEDHITTKIPTPDEFDSTTDVGEGAFQIYSLDSTMEKYEAYCAKLAEAGFTLYTTNVMNKTHCATYYNDEIVVNVLFAGGDPDGIIGTSADRALRIVAEPLSNTNLPMLAPESDPTDAAVTPVTFTMLDSAANRSGKIESRDGKLCLIIRLSNGHFIVIDSNHNSGQGKAISDYLRSLTPDGKPVIEAWIFTHFHQDHIGGFVNFCEVTNFLRYTTIKSVIYNFPNDRVIQTASHSTRDMQNIDTFYGTLKDKLAATGTKFYQARTGQKYYFGNAEIEILWTYEDIAPHNIFEDRSNPTCIGFSVNIAGQKLMITGDSSTEEFNMAAIRYGDYLKSDIVQLSHHGYGDGNVGHNFYVYVNAPYVLNSGLGRSYGSAERWAMENARVYILRETMGTCVLTLPYDGGEYESTLGS